MNSASNILFPCPHCRTKLSVPMMLAGVSGPCPYCSAQITAPVKPSAPAPRMLPPLGEIALPRTNPAPITHAGPSGLRSRIEALHSEPHAMSSSHTEKFSLMRQFLRFAIPCTILLFIAIGLLNLSRFLKRNSLTQPAKPQITQPLKSSLDDAKASVSKTPPTGQFSSASSPKNPAPKNAVADTTHHVATDTSAPAPEDPKPQAGVIAGRVVEQFLSASSFGQRMMYVQTNYSPTELQNSILAVKWPTAQFNPGTQISHPEERLTEFYFEVRFGENSVGFPRDAIILVHKRGDEDPKVVLEPLLDTIGGRLRDFASQPVSKSEDFYVIMDARIKCIDNRIPNAEKKCTFFLRSHTTGQDVATAYANEASPVRAEFDNPLAGLKWKNPMPVVVTLHWNTSEDYSRPFLEVIEIKAKNWNP